MSASHPFIPLWGAIVSHDAATIAANEAVAVTDGADRTALHKRGADWVLLAEVQSANSLESLVRHATRDNPAVVNEIRSVLSDLTVATRVTEKLCPTCEGHGRIVVLGGGR